MRNSTLKDFIKHLPTSRRISLFWIIILIFINSIFEILNLTIFVEFINFITNPNDKTYVSKLNFIFEYINIDNKNINLFELVLIFVAINVISCVLRLALLFYQTKISHLIGYDFSTGIFRSALNRPYIVHSQSNSSNIVSAVTTKSEAIIYNLVLPILTISSSSIILVTILITLFVINYKATILSVIIFTSAYYLFNLFTKDILDANSKKINIESNSIIKITQEGLGGIRDIIIDGTQKMYSDIFNKSDLNYRNAAIKIELIGLSPRYVIEVFGMVLIAIFSLTVSDQERGAVSLTTLAALAFGAQRILPLFQQIYQSFSRMRGGKDRVQEALDLYKEVPIDSEQGGRLVFSSTKNQLSFNHAINLKEVSFSYPGGSNLVFNKLNLIIPKGARIGIIGATGGGKSTLLDLIMGLLNPNDGVILVDGKKLDSENISIWRSQIAHVPQSIFLKDATIAENIAFAAAKDDIDFQRVKAAAEMAKICDEIESWPLGYGTMVGERGIRLSGGQRQRIGIARAIYKGASIIVLDEATSALDSKTECDVMNSLYSLPGNITFLIVAHRLTTLKKCDAVLSLVNGELVVGNSKI